jgi:hypothetical protein
VHRLQLNITNITQTATRQSNRALNVIFTLCEYRLTFLLEKFSNSCYVHDAHVINDISVNNVILIKINALILNVTLQRLWSIGGSVTALEAHG